MRGEDDGNTCGRPSLRTLLFLIAATFLVARRVTGSATPILDPHTGARVTLIEPRPAKRPPRSGASVDAAAATGVAAQPAALGGSPAAPNGLLDAAAPPLAPGALRVPGSAAPAASVPAASAAIRPTHLVRPRPVQPAVTGTPSLQPKPALIAPTVVPPSLAPPLLAKTVPAGAAAAAAAAVAAAAANNGSAAAATDEIIVLHFNDWHARMEPMADYQHAICDRWRNERGECGGGIARMRAVIESERSAHKGRVLVVNAGDDFIGTVWDRKYGVDCPTHFMNLLAPDAMVLGNHEWDWGAEKMATYTSRLTFPVLAANLRFNSHWSASHIRPYATKDVGGRKVCLLGVTTQSVGNDQSYPVNILEPISETKAAVSDMRSRERCAVVVLLSHLGYTQDMYMARQVKGVDIIIGGHSHSFLWDKDKRGRPPSYDTTAGRNSTDYVWGSYPTWISSPDGGGKQVAVVQAGWGSRYLGRLVLRFGSGGGLQRVEGAPVLLGGPNSANPVKEDAEMKEEVKKWKNW